MSKKAFVRISVTALLIILAGLLFIYKKDKNTDPLFTVVTFTTENGWGYRIYKQDTLFIEQPTIPGASGNLSFPSDEKAEQIGNIVVEKLNNGIFPPTVSVEELHRHGLVIQ